MTTKLTTVELTLIRDSLLKVTPTRDQADRLWDIIEKLTAIIEGERREQAKGKSAE